MVAVKMNLEKRTFYNCLKGELEYFLILHRLYSEPMIYGPINDKFLRDDIERRLKEFEVWTETHPENEPLPDALYITEMGLTNYR
jgi:hypothetical protein